MCLYLVWGPCSCLKWSPGMPMSSCGNGVGYRGLRRKLYVGRPPLKCHMPGDDARWCLVCVEEPEAEALSYATEGVCETVRAAGRLFMLRKICSGNACVCVCGVSFRRVRGRYELLSKSAGVVSHVNLPGPYLAENSPDSEGCNSGGRNKIGEHV